MPRIWPFVTPPLAPLWPKLPLLLTWIIIIASWVLAPTLPSMFLPRYQKWGQSCVYVLSRSMVSASLRSYGLWPARILCHGILQARILEWVAISFSRGSSWPRDWTHVSCIAGGFFTTEPVGKPWEQPHFCFFPKVPHSFRIKSQLPTRSGSTLLLRAQGHLPCTSYICSSPHTGFLIFLKKDRHSSLRACSLCSLPRTVIPWTSVQFAPSLPSSLHSSLPSK